MALAMVEGHQPNLPLAPGLNYILSRIPSCHFQPKLLLFLYAALTRHLPDDLQRSFVA